MISLSRLAGLDHAADFAAQILRQFGVGVGDVLVLADEAAQFFGQALQALLGDRIGGDGSFGGAGSDCCG